MKLQEMSHEDSEVRAEEDILDPVQFGQLQCLDSAGDLTESFVLRLEDWEARIEEALFAADIERIRDLAHGLKGTSSNFGAFRLMRRCSEMEQDAAKKVFPETAFLEEVMAEVRRAREALKRANSRALNVGKKCR